MVKYFIATGALTLLGMHVSFLAGRIISDSLSRAWTARRSQAVWAATAVYASGIVGLYLVQLSFGHSRILGQLNAALPMNVSWLGGLQMAPPQKFSALIRDELRPMLSAYQTRLMSARKADQTTLIQKSILPNVIMLVLESFRYDSVDPGYMPGLHRWARGGMRFNNHYSASNASQFGWFTLLYGRSPLTYHLALDARIEPQMTVTLKRSGYHLTYISAMWHEGYARMGEFINSNTFNEVNIKPAPDLPTGDRSVLRGVQSILQGRRKRPQFVAVFLGSTHYPYRYPPDREIYTPALADNLSLLKLRASKEREKLVNRYRNAASFLDHEITHLLSSIDLDRNIVVVTGDHGESIFDDGVVTHLSRLSDVQTKTPFLMRGPGTPQGLVEERMTTHMDILPTMLRALAGRSVAVEGVQGLDLIDPASLASRSSVLLVQSASEPYRLALVRPEGRLRFDLSTSNKIIRIIGSADPADRLQSPLLPDPEQASLWAESLKEQLHVLAR